MTATKKSNAITLLKPNAVQTQLQTVIDNLNTKIAKITAITNKTRLTNGKFHFGQAASANDIHKMVDVEQLLKILGFLITKKNEYETAAKMMGLNLYPAFYWSGYPFESWVNDIEIQIATVTNTSELEKLNSKVKELSQFLSNDTRILAALKEANNLL